MSFNWTKAAENTGPPSMPEGWHRVRIVKLVFEKRDGTRLSTDKGDFFMVVCENASGEQGTLSLWPTPKAAWKIAQTLSAVGVGMDELERANLTPEDFGDERTANNWFVGREGWVSATVKGKYTNIDFHHEEDVPVSVLQSSQAPASAPAKPSKSWDQKPLETEDIPF